MDKRHAGIPADGLTYSIWDPTGNITALVESPVPVSDQPQLAQLLMGRHPQVEQVGFVSEPKAADTARGEDCPHACLRMAGGEFCGNASMCTAAWYGLRHGLQDAGTQLFLGVSGAACPVGISLTREGDKAFSARVCMPPALGFEMAALAWEDLSDELGLVRMQGISHVVVGEDSPLATLVHDQPAAEAAIRAWCGQLGAEGLGVMFVSTERGRQLLTPLVYVPGADTVFWEHSCASGSAAFALLQAHRLQRVVAYELHEPGGVLRAGCDEQGYAWIGGQARRIETHRILPEA